ncbi:nucleoid-associated protein [Alphaproteobacteria bacterium]|nr:nucleoid-associated protein [Alphaproteobacteria bacterium]GHS97483.1 nucleoid-associated protein [Alphaproteobacteria bacterium]
MKNPLKSSLKNSFSQAKGLMAQMNEFKKKMADLDKNLEETVVVSKAGEGLVEVTLSGKGKVLSLKIDPSLVAQNDVGMLEDLIVVAFRNAKENVDELVAAETEKASAGLPKIPGMPF